MLGHTPNLIQRQHTRQHCPADIEVVLVERQGLMAGGRTLNRQMPGDIRVPVCSVIQQPHIGQDNGIHPETCSTIHRGFPVFPAIRLRIGIDGTEHTTTF